MAIWGTSTPKFIVGATTVLLPNSIIVPTWADARYIEQISVENGERTIEYLGDYSEFQVVINLFKEGNTTAVKAKFNEIYQYRLTTIDQFFPHDDGDYMRDSSNNAVEFAITEFRPFYLDPLDPFFRDKLGLVFKSLKYTDLSNSLP